MLPSTLAEELIIRGERPCSRLKYGLIVPSFASKYVINSTSYRGAVLWNAIGRTNTNNASLMFTTYLSMPDILCQFNVTIYVLITDIVR